jgi:hypothetical protein
VAYKKEWISMGINKLQLSRHATTMSFFIYFYMEPELIGGRLREMGNAGHVFFANYSIFWFAFCLSCKKGL